MASAVRIDQLRKALGRRFARLPSVVFVGPGAGGGARIEVQFIAKRSGRGLHRLFACPRCHEPRRILRTDEHGGIGCSACVRHRTRRQLESKRREWREHDVALEDRLLRSVARMNRGRADLDVLRALASSIVRGDAVRLDAALVVATAALEAAQLEMTDFARSKYYPGSLGAPVPK